MHYDPIVRVDPAAAGAAPAAPSAAPKKPEKQKPEKQEFTEKEKKESRRAAQQAELDYYNSLRDARAREARARNTLLWGEDYYKTHVEDPEDPEKPGEWHFFEPHRVEPKEIAPSKGNEPDTGDALVFCLSVLKYLQFYEYCLRDGSTPLKKSSLPREFLKKRRAEIESYFKATVTLALALYHKYKDLNPVNPVFPAERELSTLLQGLNYQSSFNLKEELAKDEYKYSVVVTTGLHEALLAGVEDKDPAAVPDFGIYNPDQKVLVRSSICKEMKPARLDLMRALWSRGTSTYAFGHKIFNRGFMISSRLDETAKKAFRATLQARFKVKTSVSFKTLVNVLRPSRAFFSRAIEDGRGNSFEVALKRLITRSEEAAEEGKDAREQMRHELGLCCLRDQLLFSTNDMNEVFEILFKAV